MTKRRKRIAFTALAALVAMLGAFLYVKHKQRERASAISCVLEWGRLAPFPEDIEGFTLTTEGGMFTRAFRVQFVAAPEVIEQWISDSPGLRDLQPEWPGSDFRRFIITPGGGAQRAEVEIDGQAHTVTVYVCWS